MRAQRRRAQAQAAFWNAVVEYNKSIADLHTRKGSILEYNNIGFEEGAWPEKAYWDALQRARARDAGVYMDYGWTRPRVISRGPTGTEGAGFQTLDVEGAPSEMILETLPATEGVPTPAARKPVMGDLPAETGLPMEAAPQGAPAVPEAQPGNLPAPEVGSAIPAKPRLRKVAVTPPAGSEVRAVSYGQPAVSDPASAPVQNRLR